MKPDPRQQVPDPELVNDNPPPPNPEPVNDNPPPQDPEPVNDNPPTQDPEPVNDNPPTQDPELVNDNPPPPDPELVPELATVAPATLEELDRGWGYWTATAYTARDDRGVRSRLRMKIQRQVMYVAHFPDEARFRHMRGRSALIPVYAWNSAKAAYDFLDESYPDEMFSDSDLQDVEFTKTGGYPASFHPLRIHRSPGPPVEVGGLDLTWSGKMLGFRTNGVPTVNTYYRYDGSSVTSRTGTALDGKSFFQADVAITVDLDESKWKLDAKNFLDRRGNAIADAPASLETDFDRADVGTNVMGGFRGPNHEMVRGWVRERNGSGGGAFLAVRDPK